MEDVVHPRDSPLGYDRLGQVTFDELHGRRLAPDGVEVAALARDEAVDHAHAVPAANELFAEMGTDETGAAGDEVSRHDQLVNAVAATCARPGVTFNAFWL